MLRAEQSMIGTATISGPRLAVSTQERTPTAIQRPWTSQLGIGDQIEDRFELWNGFIIIADIMLVAHCFRKSRMRSRGRLAEQPLN